MEAERPNPTICLKAYELLEINADDVVHLGGDPRNNIWDARNVGCDVWLVAYEGFGVSGVDI